MITLFKRKGHNPVTKKTFWYAQWLRQAKVDLFHIAETMCRLGKHSAGSACAVLLDFPMYLKRELMESNEVELNGFGTFKLKVNGQAKENKDDLTTRSLTMDVVFEPTAEFLIELNEAKLQFERNKRGKSKDDSKKKTDA